MLLIIDSGATKTEYYLTENGEVLYRYINGGINVNYSGDDEINTILSEFVSSHQLPTNLTVDKIVYYGAGCANEKNCKRIKVIFRQFYPDADILVYSDLMAACHALCGNNAGLVGILGTGSSSCLYDGKEIIEMAPSLGYLLGDEGSGTYLGKLFLTAYLQNQFHAELKNNFETKFKLSPAKIIHNLYQNPNPNRFMASFAPYISEHLDDFFLSQLCIQAFTAFFKSQIYYYPDYQNYKLNLLGSIAKSFKVIIEQTAADNGIQIGHIKASPMGELIRYYK